MGTTAEKGAYIIETKSLLKDKINNLGGSIDDNTTFRQYANQLQNVYDNLPKTEYQEGTEVNLGKTSKGKLDYDNGVVGIGQSSQDSTQGYNLLPTQSTQTIGNVTLTKNDDGTFDLVGNNTSSDIIEFELDINDVSLIDFSQNYYTMVTNQTGFVIQIALYNGSIWISTPIGRAATESLLYKTTGSYVVQTYNKIRYLIRVPANTNINLKNVFVMIYKGSYDSSKSFEQYTGGQASPSPSYPQQIKSVTGTQNVVVSGKNELNFVKWLENVRAYGQRNGNTGMGGGTLDSYTDNSFTFTASGNDCYSQSFTMSGTASVNKTFCELYPHLVFEVEPSTYYTLSFKRSNETLPARPMFFYLDENYNYLSLADSGSLNISSFARQTPSNCKYLLFRMGLVDHNGSTLTLSDLMLEKGNTATTYEPYITPTSYQLSLGDIELFEDSTIVRNSDGSWKYVDNFEKKRINTTPSVITIFENTTRMQFNNVLDNNVKFIDTCKCNRLQWKSMWNIDEEGFYVDNNSKNVIMRMNKNTIGTTYTEATAYFQANETYVVCELVTPIETPITDETLISQLNAWYNAHSNNGTTIITSNGNLPMIIKVRGLKGE